MFSLIIAFIFHCGDYTEKPCFEKQKEKRKEMTFRPQNNTLYLISELSACPVGHILSFVLALLNINIMIQGI